MYVHISEFTMNKTGKLFIGYSFAIASIFAIFFLTFAGSNLPPPAPFNISESTIYDILEDTHELIITENLGKNQIINVTDVFFDSSFSQGIIIKDVLVWKNYTEDVYGNVNVSLGKYKTTNQSCSSIIGNNSETITNCIDYYYDNSDKLMSCDWILEDQTCQISQKQVIGTVAKTGYLPPQETIKKDKKSSDGKVEVSKNGLVLAKNSVLKIKYKTSHPIALNLPSPDSPLNKYNITVKSANGLDEATLDPYVWNSSWGVYYQLNLSKQNDANQTVTILLNSTWFNFARVQSAGQDIRVLNETGNGTLSCEIEDFNTTSKNGTIHCRLPTPMSTIYIYSNNSAVSDGQNIFDSYDPNYKAVYHMRQKSGNLGDSTSTQANATVVGAVQQNASWTLANAYDFDLTGADGNISTASVSGLNITGNLTLELWLYYRGRVGGSTGTIIDKGANSDWTLAVSSSDTTTFQVANGVANVCGFTNGNTTITTSVWHYIVATYNGTGCTQYLDGNVVLHQASANLPAGSTSSVGIGYRNDAPTIRSINGTLDEIKISDTFRTLNYVKVNYLAGTNALFSWSGEINTTADTISPNVKITYPTNITYNAIITSLNFSVGADSITCKYSTNGALSNTSVTCGNNVTGLTAIQGANNWTAWTIDSASNENISRISFSVDSVFPTINFTNPTPLNNTFGGNTFIVNVTLTESNFANITFALYNGSVLANITTFTTPTNFTNFTGLADGTFFYNVTITDGASNSNTTELRKYTVDTTQPVPSFVTPSESNNSFLPRSNINVNVSVTETNLANITIYLMDSAKAIIRTNVSSTSAFSINYTSLSDGIYYFNATAVDNASNSNNTAMFKVTIDTTLPLIKTVYPTNTTYNTIQTAFNFSISDTNINVCWYTTNTGLTNTTITCGNNVTGLSSSQGANNWTAYINDSAGNTNSSTVSFGIDSLLPIINYTSLTETDGMYLSRSNIFVNITASDVHFSNITIQLYNGSNNAVLRSNTSTSTSFSINYTSLGDGFYIFNASSTDTYGNTNYTSTRNITLDTTISLINFTFNVQSNGTSIRQTNIFMNVTVVESNEANITYSIFNSTGSIINQTTFSTAIRSQNVTGLSDGIYFYNVTVIDLASNQNTTLTRTITLDTTYPTLNLSYPLNTTYTTAVISALNFSISDTNIQACWYSVNNGTTNTTSTCGTNITGLDSGQGAITWVVAANDSAGNTNSTFIRFYVDSLSPSINFTFPTPDNNSQISLSSFPINITGNDSNLQAAILTFGSSNYTMSCLGTNNYACNETLFSIGYGQYDYFATVNDSYGHSNVSETRTLIIYNQNPTLPATGGGASSTATTGVPSNLSDYLCKKTYDYLQNYGKTDFTHIDQLVNEIKTEKNYQESQTNIINYLFNWQNFCSDAINRTLEEKFVCDKEYYFLVDTNGNYSIEQFSTFYNQITPTIYLSSTLLKLYLENYQSKCYGATGKKLPFTQLSQDTILPFSIPGISSLDFPKCSIDFNYSLLDAYLPFFKIQLHDLTCDNIDTDRWFFKLEHVAGNDYKIKGLKLNLILIPLAGFLVILLIKILIGVGNALITGITKGKDYLYKQK